MKIDIFDVIYNDDFAVNIKFIRKQLEQFKDGEEVEVYINSPGGDVFEGVAIYNLLSEYKPTIKIIGQAASIASVIAMAGGKVQMANTALMFIHKPWTVAVGNEDDMKRSTKELEVIKKAIIRAYQNKSGMSEQEIIDIMEKEEYWTAEDCLEMKLIDEIYTPTREEEKESKRVQAKANTKLYRNQIKNIKSKNLGDDRVDEVNGKLADAEKSAIMNQEKINNLQSQVNDFLVKNAELSKLNTELETALADRVAQIEAYRQEQMRNEIKIAILAMKDKILPRENNAENNFALEQELISFNLR